MPRRRRWYSTPFSFQIRCTRVGQRSLWSKLGGHSAAKTFGTNLATAQGGDIVARKFIATLANEAAKNVYSKTTLGIVQ